MSSDSSLPILLVMIFLMFLASPSFVARAGFGRRRIWFVASSLFFLLFLLCHRLARNPPRFFDLDAFFGLSTEDIDLLGLLDVLIAYGAASLAVAACLYKPRPK